ncbi:hypothetical protein PDG61_01135 [Mycolicibacterium sp. BiH015]|uniref:hypothetical protein n=1 Tax=Mycolicibacterium sp. BiH015 TaxID=3018808 RepID=UPI0022E4FB7E|nr:hypothetical protein [Mycolicibacterium sp. BiH015]MDA2889504.1 hypothetical protein [Mycolicibacterium sp. BiH015]
MRRLGVYAAIAAAAAVTACSAQSEPAGESTPSSVTPSVGHGAFAYCLSQHGVPAPPGPAADPPAGVDRKTWETAMSECASLAPGPGPS